jgi:hypothetical protein
MSGTCDTSGQEVAAVMPKRITIADATLALIEERGALTLEDVVPEMVVLGRTRAKDPVRAVRSAIMFESRILYGRDGRLYSLGAQLEGAVFTVAPTTLERDAGVVLVRDELDLVRRAVGRSGAPGRPSEGSIHIDIFGDFFELPYRGDRFLGVDENGEPVVDPEWNVLDRVPRPRAALLLGFLDELGFERSDDATDMLDLIDEMDGSELLHGPDGWFPRLRSREVLGLRIRAGQVSAEAIDKRELKGMHVELAIIRIAEITRHLLDAEEGLGAPAVPMEDLLEILATEAPDLFRRPLPSLGRLLERGGFEVEDGLVGLPGAAWDDIRWALDPDPEAAWGFEPGDAVN